MRLSDLFYSVFLFHAEVNIEAIPFKAAFIGLHLFRYNDSTYIICFEYI